MQKAMRAGELNGWLMNGVRRMPILMAMHPHAPAGSAVHPSAHEICGYGRGSFCLRRVLWLQNTDLDMVIGTGHRE